MKIKALPPSKLRMIENDKPISLIIDSKQALKETVVDYIIHNISANNHNSRKIKIRQYQPIKVNIQLNKQIQIFIFDLPLILQKYTARSKQVQNGTVQNLTADILDFIEQLQNQSINPSIQFQGQPTIDKILTILIDRHFQQKRKHDLQGEYNEVKKFLSKKYKKVSFKVGEQYHQSFSLQSEQNSQRISRSTLNALMQRQEHGKKHLQVPTKSKLKVLVQSCNVFDFADKIQSLKKQKLITQFCNGKQSTYIETRIQVKKHYPCPSTTLASQTILQLEDWINEISLSEALFKAKYEPKDLKQNKHKTQEQSSSSQDQS